MGEKLRIGLKIKTGLARFKKKNKIQFNNSFTSSEVHAEVRTGQKLHVSQQGKLPIPLLLRVCHLRYLHVNSSYPRN